jgi:hypothetical protein
MHVEVNNSIAAEGKTCYASEDRVSGKIAALALRGGREGRVFKTKCWEVGNTQKVLTPCLPDWLADAGLAPKAHEVARSHNQTTNTQNSFSDYAIHAMRCLLHCLVVQSSPVTRGATEATQAHPERPCETDKSSGLYSTRSKVLVAKLVSANTNIMT